MTYKEELKLLLSEGHKLGDAHKILKERRNSQEESPVAQTEESDANKESEETESHDSEPVSELKVGDTVPCPQCQTPVGITVRYLNNIGKRGLHCYQCTLTFHL